VVSIEKMRSDALAAFEAAVDAVRPENLVPAQISRSNNILLIGGKPLPGASGRHVVMSIGKAAPGLAAAWQKAMPGWADEILVLTPHGVPVPPEVKTIAVILRGAHPYPDADGEASTRRLLGIAEGLGDDDLLVVLLSGGGSALMAAPEEGLALDDVHATTKALLKAGAPITEVNTVRRQLLAAAGGGLARAAHPAPVRTLILSDVLGDPLPDIASGPTVASPTTAADALAVLDRFGFLGAIPGPVVSFLENAKIRPTEAQSWMGTTSTSILANNRTAVEAAAAELHARGYEVKIADHDLVGEAAERGRELVRTARTARAVESIGASVVVFGGETTVTVRGSGRGGRNQELALAAAIELEGADNTVILAAGTDGVDGLSENAGAVVDPTTIDRLQKIGIDARKALDYNDSGTALAATGDAIHTGPTGTNVCDLTIVLSTRA